MTATECPDLYDLKNCREWHGRLKKSWQHCTDILELCTVGKQSAVIGKPVRQSFTVKLCRVGHDCGYDLFIDQFQSYVESEMFWDCRTQCEGIRGQCVGIRGQRMDGREDWINITIASCLIGVTFTFSYISRYAYIYLCIYVYLSIIWVYSWVEGNSTLLIALTRKSRSYNCGKWEWKSKFWIVYSQNIGVSYEVNDTRLSPFRYQSMPIEAITPIWYMVVAMVGQIIPVKYWWSCVAYCRSNTSVIPVSYSCHTKIVLAVLYGQWSGVKVTIWWFCHDHDRSWWSAMIGNIGKEWSAHCYLDFSAV